ncbi:DNA helicase RecQ [Clostridium manihotivorum]|uniref:DNA helicase RecQ n=1 Tax=Clostridium manihotivorum TaxID=2320868 RepID=A0A410DZZ7_9CLOT|nr:DNA helicase RecQ [Clostridium manihotivorum]QAA34624.1 DNA helicase RecQ [Clostridium manihotivorum]
MDNTLRVLKKVFGFSSFRKGQREIIETILSGKDVFAVMPTGGGKSICYQIPAILMGGVTLVISPLISLMKDQVDSIKDVGINAAFINSTIDKNKIIEIIEDSLIGKYKLIYISPERLEMEYFVKLIRSLNISQIAVDEAHCVSQWGHDFRKSYRFILPFVNSLAKRPVITAFTATATEEVRNDSVKLLGLINPYLHISSFNRDNLSINIHKEVDKLEFVKDVIRDREEESGIIYCSRRKDVDGLYSYLKERGYNVAKYHSGLKDEEKEAFQDDFLFDRKEIMIATNAFGMGIDKSNVRYVIHFSLPKNIENYYQEIGRGGRDGEKCDCHLLYSREDIPSMEYMINTSTLLNRREIELRKLQAMVDFCETQNCYRQFILNYFGEGTVKQYCNNCSNCLNSDELRDITVEAQKILSCLYRTKERYGISVIVDILRGFSGPKIIDNKLNELSTYGIMQEYSSKFIKDVIQTLIEEGYVDRKEGTYSMIRLNSKSINILKGKEKVMARLKDSVDDTVLDQELFKKLRILRRDLSQSEKVKPYIIFSDSTLIQIANLRPKSREELMNIRGVGEKKIEKYGDRVLRVVHNHTLIKSKVN